MSIVTDCKDCPLHLTRTQIVEPVGSLKSQVILIGEAPGKNEDEGGEPFIGRSGKLLFKLIKEELGLDREDCYVTNTVKCRPPNNRRPKKEEIEACRPKLEEELKNTEGKVVITLGSTASKNLSEYSGKKLFPIYHPAAALYRPSLVKNIREDLQNVSQSMGRSRES